MQDIEVSVSIPQQTDKQNLQLTQVLFINDSTATQFRLTGQKLFVKN